MLVLAFTMATVVGGEFPLDKAPVIYGSIALEEKGRYRVTKPFNEAVEWYKRHFRYMKQSSGISWRTIVNNPSVRAVHMASRRRRSTWAGINIYETKGEVRLFVVPRDPPKEEKTKKRRRR